MIRHPVTFKSKNTFICLPQLKSYSTINLKFLFKTLESNGLILFNSGKGQDFIAVELSNGQIDYIFNLGDGPKRITSNSTKSLSNNKWHSVTIGRPAVYEHTLIVDDTQVTISSKGFNIHLDLDGLLYLGGVKNDMYESLPKIIQSKHGFKGCLASLIFNGENVNLFQTEVVVSSTLVSRGCYKPKIKCTHACANHGICVRMWNSYVCDCDMTSFNGPTCSDGKYNVYY